jgi:hypothetical protein
MKTHRVGRIRRFRFNQPQQIAAGLLALFLAQGLWLSAHQPTQAGGRSQLALLLAGLPFLAVGVLLGGALWWVARRLYGNQGGYTALALYCFSPEILRASSVPNAEILAALGVYGGIYTSIGVAHAMQGPRRKWRPRILLLTAIFAAAAAAHLAALAQVAVLGFAFMLWVAEGRRKQLLPVLLIAVTGALVVLFLCCGFSPRTFLSLFRSGEERMSLSFQPAMHFFGALANIGTSLAVAASAVLYLGVKRSRYFGNTVPLLSALILSVLVLAGAPEGPLLWALPFLFTFVGGVFADAFETSEGRLAVAAAGAIVLVQVVLCVQSLPGLK